MKKYATVAAGVTIKIDAFINGNDFYADNATKASVTGVGNVKYIIYPKCDLITGMTPSATTKTLKVEAGKSGTFPLTYTSTGPANSNWPATGICGETTTVSGTNAAWATYASGITTVKVPTGTKAGKYTITLTGSYGASGGGTDTSKSTATGVTTLTVEVTEPKAAGGAGAGLNDVATTAASVVAGVLGGAIFAAAFAPAPTAALNAGASATASGSGVARE